MEFDKLILQFFDDTRAKIPMLHHTSFEVTHYDHSNERVLHGFIHIGNGCTHFDSTFELMEIINRYEILFRRF